jgi:hypothetical protein
MGYQSVRQPTNGFQELVSKPQKTRTWIAHECRIPVAESRAETTPNDIRNGCHGSQERGSKGDIALSDNYALAQAWEARDATRKAPGIVLIRMSVRLSVCWCEVIGFLVPNGRMDVDIAEDSYEWLLITERRGEVRSA